VTRYTQLRHAGYYEDGLTDKERKDIEKQVDEGTSPTAATSPGTTTTKNLSGLTGKADDDS
jgi:hypothetical protein